ncbi:tryptophan synthase subunit alpha [Streptomyces sp. NBC_01217]|nr:tryptophan synthase subunit alpha [Streptomyces sp. NBC_01217]
MTTHDALHTLLTQPACSLAVFVPAGMHTAAAERRHLDALAHAGCALFEIGLAHHTAVLDGPVIQSAYRRALMRGSVLDRTLRAVEHAASLRPTVVMTYWEPVSRHGPEHLARLFAEAGATGVMVVDLPTHQAVRWQAAAQSAGLRTPRLVPRHTTDADLAHMVTGASGWLYAPASSAPTGYQGPLDIPALSGFTQRLRAASPLPVVSGVGVSTPDLAARVAPLVDAVVIGTPIVRALATAPDQAPILAAAFAQALRPTTPRRTVPDRPTPVETLARITADALTLHRALRTNATNHTHALTERITEAQALARIALQLFRDLAQPTPQATSADLQLLLRVAQITKAAQDAGAELTAALARALENQRRRNGVSSGPVVLIGPSPQQFIESATDLLDRIPTLYRHIYRAQAAFPDTRTCCSPWACRRGTDALAQDLGLAT